VLNQRQAAGALLAAALLALLISAGPVGGAESPSRSVNSVFGKRGPCGTAERPPLRYEHVVWIVFENKDYDHVIGHRDAPYFNTLARACGVAANFIAEVHPSAPNYVAMTSGGTHGLANDDDPVGHPIHARSIFSQLGRGGWRAFIEAMPSNCRLRSVLPEYYARHNAPAYYPDIRRDCLRCDVPLRDELNLSARLTYIAPNSCHSMHTCGVAAGDAWLKRFLPKLLNSRQYRAGHTAIFLTWDEADEGGPNQIPTLVLAPSVHPGTVARKQFDHYSLLRTTEELLGLSEFLGQAATAPSMRSAFGI
jgi:hypothetical protein